jgi:hypothetical protein
MRTCDSTCVFTIGKMVSYSELLIFTKPSGIIEIPSIWRRSAFSLIADTRGWSAATRQKRRAVTSWMPFSLKLSAV